MHTSLVVARVFEPCLSELHAPSERRVAAGRGGGVGRCVTRKHDTVYETGDRHRDAGCERWPIAAS